LRALRSFKTRTQKTRHTHSVEKGPDPVCRALPSSVRRIRRAEGSPIGRSMASPTNQPGQESRGSPIACPCLTNQTRSHRTAEEPIPASPTGNPNHNNTGTRTRTRTRTEQEKEKKRDRARPTRPDPDTDTESLGQSHWAALHRAAPLVKSPLSTETRNRTGQKQTQKQDQNKRDPALTQE